MLRITIAAVLAASLSACADFGTLMGDYGLATQGRAPQSSEERCTYERIGDRVYSRCSRN